MDPVSIFLYGIAIAAGGLVVRDVVKPFFVIGKNKLIFTYRRLFEKRNILVLGGPQTGKTSLILLMVKNRPYLKEQGDKRIGPDRTVGVAIVEEETSDTLGTPNFNHLENILRDVGGEFTDQWKQLIHELDPHGIIYMIDGRKKDKELIDEIEGIFDFVLSQYPSNMRNLRTLHIFANFADKLDKDMKRQKPHQIVQSFQLRFQSKLYDHLRELRWNVSITQLSPDEDEWSEAVNALEKFGSDLRWV